MDNKIIKELGNCKTQHIPFSIFKITIALIGFDKNILINHKDISNKYITYYNPNKYPVMYLWKQDTNPKQWMDHLKLMDMNM